LTIGRKKFNRCADFLSNEFVTDGSGFSFSASFSNFHSFGLIEENAQQLGGLETLCYQNLFFFIVIDAQ
jgi:hypothetical protein